MLKNKFCLIILSFILALPAYSLPEAQDTGLNLLDEDALTPQTTAEEVVLPEVPTESVEQNTFKEPVSKRKIVKKFLFAMLGVVVSSLTIYLCLSIYNKFRYGTATIETTNNSETDLSLKSPDNLQESIKTFIDKTKWE